MVSGRDKDPGYNKKKVTKPVARKPTASAPTPIPPKKVEPEPTPTPAQTTKVVAPVVPEKDIPKPEPVIAPAPIDKKPEHKKENTESKPVVTATAAPPPEKKHNPHKTSKKSKLLGILIAILLLVGLFAIGYMVISSIMEKEAIEKLDDSFTNDGIKSTRPNSTDAINDNKESIEGQESNSQDGAIGQEVESEENSENGDETELSNENSMESEMKEAKEEYSNKSSSEQEKEAIKTKIIRKKGEFEIPSWIIAFSANTKKPLANTNYSTLEALGYDAGIYWIPKYFPGGSEMYKVYVGPYKSAQEAESMLPAIKNLQPDAYVLKIEE
jgi:hypothetical protein